MEIMHQGFSPGPHIELPFAGMFIFVGVVVMNFILLFGQIGKFCQYAPEVIRVEKIIEINIGEGVIAGVVGVVLTGLLRQVLEFR